MNDAEAVGVRKTLTAAAMTYVAGALASIAQLLYFLMLFGGSRDSRRRWANVRGAAWSTAH